MDCRIIDFHAHAFSDSLAPKAIKALTSRSPDIVAHLDGTISSLIASMDNAGIAKSVICSIATKPSQFEPILNWSLDIASERIIPFGSVHPDDPMRIERISKIADKGLLGVKMHPYYQDFFLDEEKMFEFYQKVSDEGLILVVHTGYDIAFAHDRRAEPRRILNVAQQFPELKLITTHLGSWQLWDEVETLLLGKNIYMEISFALEYLSDQQAKRLLTGHPAEYLIFGSDSPWASQKKTLDLLKNLKLTLESEEKILYSNAAKLLQKRLR